LARDVLTECCWRGENTRVTPARTAFGDNRRKKSLLVHPTTPEMAVENETIGLTFPPGKKINSGSKKRTD